MKRAPEVFKFEKIASIPLAIAAMAHLPSNKASVLVYETRTKFSAYLPLIYRNKYLEIETT
jgi:hypothetical protein